MRNERVSEPYRVVSAAEHHAPDGERETARPSDEAEIACGEGVSPESLSVSTDPSGTQPVSVDSATAPVTEEAVALAEPASQAYPAWPVLPRGTVPRQPWEKPSPHTPTHVPWQAGDSWGATTLVVSATTAAGASYLFWWISGFLIYFSERNNRYVRFHALQSIILTGVLTIAGVSAALFAALMQDITRATHQVIFYHLGLAGSVIVALAIVFTWLCVMTAAWTGNYLRLPIIGSYAERYSAPPRGPTGNPLL